MKASLVMFLAHKKIALVCFLSLAFTAPGVIAQTTNSSEENVTFTGESLQGIQTQRVEANTDYERTPNLDVTIEPEQESSGSGNEFIGGLTNQKKGNSSSTYTLDKINTNQGDSGKSRGGTIPFANF